MINLKTTLLLLSVGLLFAAEPPKEVAKKTEPVATIKPDVKVKLLVAQAKLTQINQTIDQSQLGKERAALTEKFQQILAEARGDNNCKGGEPTFSDDDVVCKPAEKLEAKAPPKTKE